MLLENLALKEVLDFASEIMSGKQVLASLLVKMLIDWVCLGVLGGPQGEKQGAASSA